jgi:hypothetical protein
MYHSTVQLFRGYPLFRAWGPHTFAAASWRRGASLIAALNAELTKTFPEPGAAHFSLSGAFLIAYVDDVAVGCGAVRWLDETTAAIA